MATVPEILTEMGDWGFADYSTARKVSAINNAYWDVAGREPWPFLEKELSLNFDGSSPTPSNAPTDLSAVLKFTNIATGQRLVPVRLDDLEDNYATQVTQVGTPMVYYFLKDALKTVPISSTGTATYRLKYLCWPAALTATSVEADILIPARHHEVIVLGALARLYKMEDDSQMSAILMADFERKIANMRQDLWRHHYDGPDFIHQVEDYDYYYIG